MIADGRFPRLSPDGAHVACGALVVSVDGVAIGPGTTPVWVDGGSVLYTRQPDGALMLGGAGRTPVELRPAGHEPSSLCCDGRGRFAFRDTAGVWTSDRNLTVTGAFRPTWAGRDLVWCLDTGTTADLYREGLLVARTVHDVRGMPDGRLCFILVDGAEQWTCVQHPDGTISSWRLAGAQEYRPLVLDIHGEAWVLSHTRDDRLLLRTGNNGLVVATGATFEPDAVFRADGTVRIVWSDAKGRLVDRLLTPLTKTTFGLTGEGMAPETRLVRDLRATPQPTIAPWPPSGKGWTRRDDITEIDIVEYLLGSQDWSRNGMHVEADAVTYSHPFQSRVIEDGENHGCIQHTKFAPPDTRAATWTFTDTWLGLAYDGTNELEQGYRFVLPWTDDTAALYPRRMKVGRSHARVTELDILDLATGHRRRAQWAGWVEAVWQNDAPIGDLPAGTLHAEVMFEPAYGEATGWRERNFCAQGLGCWYWDQHRKTPDALPDMRWVGTSNAPRVPDIPVRFADAVPVAQPTPTPDPDPEPEPEPQMPIPEPTITDPEAQNAGGRIEHFYDAHADTVGYTPRTVHTDPLSYVWSIRYYQQRQAGQPHEPAIQAVERAMAAAAGVLEPEPEPDPTDPVDPTAMRRGPLRIDGRAYVDVGGRRLPYYIHGGDLISRYSRDREGAQRMLDEVVTLRADGVRAWTWLLGEPHWRGRLFRGEWDVLRAFVRECQQRNLRLVLSQGDLWMAGETTARRWLADLPAFLRAEGVEWFDFVDGANEGRNTKADDPDVIADAMRPLAGVGPILSLTDVPEGADASRWMRTPAHVLDHHPQFSDPDGCIRRSWNAGYDGRDVSWLWINSEPRGWGRNVTVCDTINAAQQLALAAATWISGGAYVAMSSPGVISDGTKNGHVDAGESFLDMPGFRRLAELRAWLPRDVMTWRRVHGGDRPGSIRVFATEAGNDLCRADHAINEATGEYVAVLSAGRSTRVREASEEDFPGIDSGIRIVTGRLA